MFYLLGFIVVAAGSIILIGFAGRGPRPGSGPAPARGDLRRSASLAPQRERTAERFEVEV